MAFIRTPWEEAQQAGRRAQEPGVWGCQGRCEAPLAGGAACGRLLGGKASLITKSKAYFKSSGN